MIGRECAIDYMLLTKVAGIFQYIHNFLVSIFSQLPMAWIGRHPSYQSSNWEKRGAGLLVWK